MKKQFTAFGKGDKNLKANYEILKAHFKDEALGVNIDIIQCT
jgi:hypothetical protein